MIRQLFLRNWQCYRGEHVLELGSMAYSLSARHEDDPGRSNASGKSALMEAVRFALDGRIRKERQFDADGWITVGEREGCVAVVLGDGTSIRREKRRGKATQVRFTSAAGAVAAQDEAQVEIFRHLALGPEDFQSTAYFEQRHMARILHADPADRLTAVSGWLGLGLADRAEERAAEIASGHARELAALLGQKVGIEAFLRDAPASGRPDAGPDAGPDVAPYEARISALRAELEELRAVEAAAAKVLTYDAVVARGMALKEATEVARARAEDVPGLEVAVSDARLRLGLAREATESCRRVAGGQFDGSCPVAGRQCPVAHEINVDRTMARTRLGAAEGERRRAEDDLSARLRELDGPAAARDAARALEKELVYLRDEERKLRAEATELRLRAFAPRRIEAEVMADLREAERERDAALTEVALVRAQEAERMRAEAALADLEVRIRQETTRADLAVRARDVFRAARRRVAERALDQISADASRLLSDAGVDLEVAARWEREGKGPAKACERCGSAFPASAKVRACERCGAERGQHHVQRLDFTVSSRSGGADDVAGVGLQLAAGAWLLSTRSSPWSTALLDEPFAAVDRTWRRGLAAALARQHSYRQLVVVSHELATAAMFPGRIEVVVARNGNRRIEVS